MSTSRLTFVVLCVTGILHMAHFYSLNDGAYEIVAVEGIKTERREPLMRFLGNERVRRQAAASQNVRGFSEEEKIILLEKHNALRRIPGASNMNYMYWSEELAALAQDWAERCVFSHRPGAQRKNIAGFAHSGENLYASTGGYDPESVVQAWYDEVQYYHYNTMACTGVCGHYTQIVWATSYAVGCGVVYCPVLQNVNFGKGYHVACNYGPGGNYVGKRPYKTGEPCSQCQDDALFCIDGECAKYPVIGSSRPVGGASRGAPTLHLTGCFLASVFLALTLTTGFSLFQ